MIIERTKTVVLLFVSSLLLLCGCNGDDSPSVVMPVVKSWQLTSRRAVNIPEPSGVAFDSSRQCLWIVSDNTGLVYKTSFEGDVIHELPYICEDPEGICLGPDGNSLFIIEELNADLVQIDLEGNELNRIHIANFESEGNQGFEGLIYHPGRARFYLVHEKDPVALVVLSETGAVLNRIAIDYAHDISDITLDKERGELLLLSDEDETVINSTLDGEFIDEWATEIKKAEGIAKNGDTLYVVSDSEEELYIFVYKDQPLE